MRNILPAFLIIMLLAACAKKAPVPKGGLQTGPSYFPVKKYMIDQYYLYAGQPYPLYKIVTAHHKTDSTLTNMLQMDFADVFLPFAKGDISDTVFLGQYQGSDFVDEATGNRTIIYTAKDPKLYNQMTQITIDGVTGKPASIFVKNVAQERSGMKTQQATYIPHSYLQILEDVDGAKPGEGTIQTEYRFLQDNTNDEGTVQ